MKKIFNLFTTQVSCIVALAMLTAGVSYGQCPAGESQLCVTYTTGIFNGENSWLLWNASTSSVLVGQGANPPGGTTPVCVPDGDVIELYAWESFGDSWNGTASISVTGCEDGSANGGCMNSNEYIAPTLTTANGNGVWNGVDNTGGSLVAISNPAFASIVTGCSECVIECPDDITVGNDESVCGAFVELDAPSFDPNGCNLEAAINPVSVAVELEHSTIPGFPNGTFANNVGTYTIDWDISPLCDSPMPSCVDEICFDLVIQGDYDFITEQIILTSNELGISWDSDATNYGQCTIVTLTSCLTAAQWDAARADCLIDMTLQATGTGISSTLCAFNGLMLNATMATACDTYATCVTLPGGDELTTAPAGGVFPVGCSVVTYKAQGGTLIPGGGGTGSGTGSGTTGGGSTFGPPGIPIECEYKIVVEDTEAPVFDCPRDRTINLGNGECCEVIDYDISVFNNCPLPPTTELVEPLLSADEPMNDNNGGASDWTIYFDITNNTGLTQGLSSFVHPTIGTPTSCTVWTTPGTSAGNNANAGVWTMVPVTPGAFMPGAMTGVFGTGSQPLMLNVPILLAPGQSIGIAINCIGAGPAYFNGPCQPFTQNGMTITGNVSSTTLFGGAVFNPRCWPGQVFFGEPIPVVAYEFVSGLLPGDAATVGTTETCYTAEDAVGNMSECCFDITVNDVPNVTSNMTCDDAVNVSVDENCQVLITADMFLEGGPYSCFFDCYEVYVKDEHGHVIERTCFDKLKADLDPSDVGANDLNGCTVNLECGTYIYEVYDACRDNTCWGEFTVEDKIAPAINTPEDATITCMQSPEPSEDCFGAASASFPQAGLPAQVGIFSTTTTIAGLPAAAQVTNVTLDLELSHSWINDIGSATLTSPSGAQVTLFSSICPGFGQMNLVGTFDDDNGSAIICAGGTPYVADPGDCTAPTTPATATGVFTTNTGDLNTAFDGSSVLGDWTIEMNDAFGGDGGCIASATINIEYVIPGVPAASLVNGIRFVDVDGNEVDPDDPGAIAVGCDDNLTYVDDVFDNGCDNSFIIRTWTATDAKGNQSSVQQRITTIQVGADGVGADWFWPENVVTLDCGVDSSPEGIFNYFRGVFEATSPCPDPESCDEDTDPYVVASKTAGTIWAYPNSLVDKMGNRCSFVDNACNMIFDYSDQVLNACGADCPGNAKIIRTWTALDWCTAETVSFVQIIHAKDNSGPVVDMSGAPGIQASTSITVGAHPWGCVAEFALPAPEHLTDNCSETIDYTVSGPVQPTFVPIEGGPGYWHVDGAPLGQHVFTITATDCCGNEGTGSIIVNVVDNSPPTPVAVENIVVGLTFSPTNPDAGSAKVYVDMIDLGSNDGACGPVKKAIRRIDDVLCGNVGNNTFFNFNDLPNNQQPTDHSRNDTDGGQFVKFCCDDLLNGEGEDLDGDGVNDYVNITVELGVWDDADGDGWPASSLGDKFARTWATVRLEAKVDPVLQCPPNAMITCDLDEQAEPVISNILGRAHASTACGVAEAKYTDVCDFDADGDGAIGGTFTMMGMTINEAFNKPCHYGPIVRTWSIPGTNKTCDQIIIVKEPTTLFSGSYYLVDANGDYILNGTRPIANDAITFPYEGDAVDINDDNFDDYSEVHLDCVDDLGNPEPTWWPGHCSLVGWTLNSDTLDFEGDACRKIINEYCVIDWCQYDPNGDRIHPTNGDMKGNTFNPGKWCWTVIGKLLDPYAPVVTAGDDTFDAIPGGGGSGGYPTSAACFTTSAEMTAVATDLSEDEDGDPIDNACPSEWIKWVVLVDINDDWSYDLEFSSFISPDNPNQIPCGTDTNGNGIPDFKVGSPNCDCDNADTFATSPGDPYTIRISDAMAKIGRVIPADCGETRHRVEWTAYDGCGNVASTTSYFTVADRKAPTPYCVNLSTAIMDIPAGGTADDAMVELWAIDFDFGSFDNCTADDELLFTFSDDPSTVVPEFRSATRRFTCADLAGGNPATLTLPIYVWDGCGNRDFCEVNLRLIDTHDNCGTPTTGSASIGGVIMTETGQTVENVDVMNEEMPVSLQEHEMTGETGDFMFEGRIMGMDYMLSGTKNDDYLNGVSTVDIVMIQRHILGIDPIDSPYKMIAADVNNDQQIDGSDLIELRKLVLGIYTELPANGSWRFVDADQTLDVSSPWNFDETIEISDLASSMFAEDFIGVKIGDMNEDVIANGVQGPQGGSTSSMNINFDDTAVNPGQTVEIVVSADQSNLYGYQFTLATPGLQLVSVEAANANVTEANFGVFGDVLTTSWNNTQPMQAGEMFTLTFKSTVQGQLSDILDLNGDITKAEAYIGSNLDVMDIKLNNSAVDAEFALMQNEPNPFSGKTTVGFVMAETADMSMTIYDVTGKVLSVLTGNYSKGYNEIELSKSELGASGVLYYQFDSGDFTATKKMIIIE